MITRIRSAESLRKHFEHTYFDLRMGIALMGAALPPALYLGGALGDGGGLRGSMSAYYYSPTMGDVFVGALFAVGALLFLYRGFSTKENLALDLAGVFAVLTAVIPTAASGDPTTTRSILHGTVAVLFFGCIAYVCIRRAGDTLGLIGDRRSADRFRAWYRVLGVSMIVSPLAAVILSFLLAEDSSVLFFVEAFAVWVFASFWVSKSIELRSTNAEHLALDGRLAPLGGAGASLTAA